MFGNLGSMEKERFHIRTFCGICRDRVTVLCCSLAPSHKSKCHTRPDLLPAHPLREQNKVLAVSVSSEC